MGVGGAGRGRKESSAQFFTGPCIRLYCLQHKSLHLNHFFSLSPLGPVLILVFHLADDCKHLWNLTSDAALQNVFSPSGLDTLPL